MKLILILTIAAVVLMCCEADSKSAKKQLQIGIKKKVENCQKTAKRGDSLSM